MTDTIAHAPHTDRASRSSLREILQTESMVSSQASRASRKSRNLSIYTRSSVLNKPRIVLYSEQREQLDSRSRSDVQLVPLEGNIRADDERPFSPFSMSFEEEGGNAGRGQASRFGSARRSGDDAVVFEMMNEPDPQPIHCQCDHRYVSTLFCFSMACFRNCRFQQITLPNDRARTPR